VDNERDARDMLTVADVARRTGLSKGAIYAQVHAGHLEARTPPGLRKVLIPRDAFDRWVASWKRVQS
jgi:excisionase family DNA binding protein